MLRTFVITEKTDLKTLSGKLLDARFTGARADAAIEALKRLNPQVDFDKIGRGTVLFVPDAPGFRATSTDLIPAEVLDDFEKLVEDGLTTAQIELDTGNQSRADERKETFRAIEIAGRIVGNDPELVKLLSEASDTTSREEELDKEASTEFADVSAAIRKAVSQLAKTL